METAITRNGRANEPAWNVKRKSATGLDAEPLALHLRAGGRLSQAGPREDEAGDAYAYPLPATEVAEPGPGQGGRHLSQLTWKAPGAPGGAQAYTTAPLAEDLVVAGHASLDLWLESTAADTDLQATVTEVRPDGLETYVQRGWLRASHRKLDPSRSTALRPWHTHRRGDAAPLTIGEPTKLRLEVFPFAHALREGSRPGSGSRLRRATRASGPSPLTRCPRSTPSCTTPSTPSRLVLGHPEGERAEAPRPACDTLRNQPCRTDPLASPAAGHQKKRRGQARGVTAR